MVLDAINRKEDWETNLEKFPNASFLQSWEWGDFQEFGLGKRVYRTKDFGLCIVEPTKLGNILYIPRGPLLDWSYPSSKTMLSKLIYLVGDGNFVALRIDPALISNAENAFILKDMGFKYSNSIMQVENAWVMDLSGARSKEELSNIATLQGMHKKLRGEIKRSKKKGLEVKIKSDIDGIEIFINMLNLLATRKGFKKREDSYYRDQWKYMSQSGKEKLFIGYFEGEPIASALIAFDPLEASYLHAASVEGYSNIYAPASVLWEAIKYSKELGCSRFNFWGVIENTDDKNNPGYGYSRFKMRFGGKVEKYVGTMDYIFEPIIYKMLTLQDTYRSLLYTHR